MYVFSTKNSFQFMYFVKNYSYVYDLNGYSELSKT